jgi:hypothetical protein
MKKVILTVDLERDFGDLKTAKCMKTLPKFVEILDRNEIRATFFVTGNIVPKFSKELRKIAKKHEIACHGLNHKRLTEKPLEQVKSELKEAKKIIKRNVGVNPVGFRAPALIIDEKILEILPEIGFKYDSSVVPGFAIADFLRNFPDPKIFKYFTFDSKKDPYYIGKLLEIPVSKKIIPFGTNWFQFVGKNIFSWLFSLSDEYNIVIYSHMADFCSADFDLCFKRRIHYWNRGLHILKSFEEFLNGCKEYYEFIPARDLLK